MRELRIVLVHNRYRFRGGEDVAFELARDLLADAGHVVETITTSSAEVLEHRSTPGVLVDAVRGTRGVDDLEALIRTMRPDVVHFHNTFPALSPRIFEVPRKAGVPAAITLHNYRHSCLNGFLYRDGEPCRLCIDRNGPWSGVRHACYHDSRAASLGAAVVQLAHRRAGTFAGGLAAYVAPSHFAAGIARQAGVPAERLHVIPHAVFPVPEVGDGRGGYAAFAGRLSPEKGVESLFEAWRDLGALLPLRIAGTGPLEGELTRRADGLPAVQMEGPLDRGALLEFVGRARVVIVPSRFYETFGLVAAESLAVGTPVLVSDIGALPEVAGSDGGTTFKAGSANSLLKTVRLWLSRTAEPADYADQRAAARRRFEAAFSPTAHVTALTDLYRKIGR